MKYKTAYLGVFIALAMIFSYIESLASFLLVIPGAKLGLANLITVIALVLMGYKEGIAISVIRIVLTAILFGGVFSLAYSLAGGILSLVFMIIAKKSGKFSIMGISIIGAVCHNIGQILVAVMIVSEIWIASYLPVLLILGIVTGFIIGVISNEICKKVKLAGGLKYDRVY